MEKEIERRFLLREDGKAYIREAFYDMFPSIPALEGEVRRDGRKLEQGYVPPEHHAEILERLGIRLRFAVSHVRLRNEQGTYTVTPKNDGTVVRDKVDHVVDEGFFYDYWHLTQGRRVHKSRLRRAYPHSTVEPEGPYRVFTVEFDVFRDRDLVIAEVEVDSVDSLSDIPILGKDISSNQSYRNYNLAH